MGFLQIKEYFPHLVNPKKYTGRRPITLRSSYEIRFVKHFLDKNENIVKWSSEDIVIPYKYRIDQKIHRYFVDFWFQRADGAEFLVEVKPSNQLVPPKQKRKTAAFTKRVEDYYKNQDKWAHAKAFCKRLRKEKGRNIEFRIITEKELF